MKNPGRMTEAQYIFATNLAKVRVLRSLVRDLSPQDALIKPEWSTRRIQRIGTRSRRGRDSRCLSCGACLGPPFPLATSAPPEEG